MYEIILWPSKCPSKDSWIQKHKDGEKYIVNNEQYKYHKNHGCMKPIKCYKMITTNKRQCPVCDSIIITRKKKIEKRF